MAVVIRDIKLNDDDPFSPTTSSRDIWYLIFINIIDNNIDISTPRIHKTKSKLKRNKEVFRNRKQGGLYLSLIHI